MVGMHKVRKMTFLMDGMHKVRKMEGLIAYHHFAHKCKNKRVHVKNIGVFIVLKRQKLYICLISYDHGKISHDCTKQIWKAIEILCLWTISHDY